MNNLKFSFTEVKEKVVLIIETKGLENHSSEEGKVESERKRT